MATVNETFFEALLSPKAAKWSAGVAFNRSNPLPLDQWSVFEDEASAIAYLSAANAYPGQVIAYAESDIEADEAAGIEFKAGGMVACVLSSTADGTGLELKKIGTIPTGDNKTIEVTTEGMVSLLGASSAANGTLPMVGENGKLIWKTLEDIGAGDGNDNTTYEFTFADQKITIKPLFNGQPIKVKDEEGNDTEEETVYELDLSDFVTTEELQAAIEAIPTPEDKDTTYSVAEAEKVLKLTGTEFATELSLVYKDNRISLTGIGGEEIAGFDASVFVEDGVLQNVEYNEETRELVFTWNIVTGTDEEGNITYKTDVVSIADLVDTYTAGDGLDLTNNAFSIKLAKDSEDFLSVDANGLKLSGVQDAIDAAKQAAIDADKNTTYTLSNNGVTVTLTPSEGDAQSVTLDAYTKSEAETMVDNKIASVTGGESAADVKLALESYRNAINKEIYGDEAEDWTVTDEEGEVIYTPQYGTTSRIDTLETKVEALEKVGAQENVLESVIGAPDNRLVISAITTNKTITIDDANLRSDIADAKKAGEDAAGAASTAQQTAEAAQGTANEAKNAAATNVEAITALQQRATTAEGKITELETAINNETSGLAATFAKATQNATDIAALNAKDNTHDQDIADLKIATGNNATAITNLQSAIGNVYTKTESDAKYATIATVGTPDEGKTIVEMIAEVKSEASYDDTAIQALIQANTEAIAAEKERAEGIEADHEERIAEMETFWAAADDPEGTIDKLAEIVAYIEADKTGALDMAADIKANTDAIAAINNESTGILATAKGYTDSSIAALQASIHGVDDKTIKLVDNKAYVAEVSTDILVQGSVELILSAGNATGYTN